MSEITIRFLCLKVRNKTSVKNIYKEPKNMCCVVSTNQ